ncbi:MAG TPA: LD-carboxypeptidase [Myxococcales bacterium]|nr:LD-carboxypeptidase [Myxococcales bacterium]
MRFLRSSFLTTVKPTMLNVIRLAACCLIRYCFERMSVQKTISLGPGATIAVVAPAGPAPKERVEKGVVRLHSMGFETRIYGYSEGPRHYLAGSDAERARVFMEAYLDTANDAVWCLRGGFGSARTLDHLDFDRLSGHIKPVIGFSDISALLLTLTSRLRQVSFHGPVVTQMGDLAVSLCEQVLAVLDGSSTQLAFMDERKIYQPGSADGPLMGGNLSILCSLLGTNYFPDLKGSILFIEDVGEPLYRLDRMLNQLRQSGVLSGVAGVALGDFGLQSPKDKNQAASLWNELSSWIDGPVISGLPCGHFEHNLCIPLGIEARLDSQADHLLFLETVVQ